MYVDFAFFRLNDSNFFVSNFFYTYDRRDHGLDISVQLHINSEC